jgi:hypothetical protein
MEIDSNTLNKGKRDEIIKKFYRLKICKKKVRKTGGRVGNFMPQASVTLHTGIYRDPQRGTGKAYPSGNLMVAAAYMGRLYILLWQRRNIH